MKKNSITSRIARNFTLGSGLLCFIAFAIIYTIVYVTVNHRVNQNLMREANLHLAELKIENRQIRFKDLLEWREREHSAFELNPVFTQIVDSVGLTIEKSPNLKTEALTVNFSDKKLHFLDKNLDGRPIRQVQLPILQDEKVIGYLLVAVSLEDAKIILKNLLQVLFISFPALLFILHFISLKIAASSITPIKEIITTAKKINKDSLGARVALPNYRDELYALSETLNNLLDRIEEGIGREKQFTADVSHELRTPITTIKGTLEVLLRKPRNEKEYREKINYCLSELNRSQLILDNLLMIARFDNDKVQIHSQKVDITEWSMQNIERFKLQIERKALKFQFQISEKTTLFTDPDLLTLILNNLLSNAVKYTSHGGTISLKVENLSKTTVLSLTNSGQGIDPENLPYLFDRFYRPNNQMSSTIEGEGLGLPIVKKLCDALKIDIKVWNPEEGGTCFELHFIN